MIRLMRALALATLALLVSGCATFRSYDQELDRTLSRVQGGDLDGALQTLGSKGKDDDLLFQMERGELLRLKRQFGPSDEAWFKADKEVLAWENIARTSPKRLLPSAASYVINEKLRDYEGHDYEKVMLTTRLALNHLAQGDFDKARVAIKRTHEREALIAELRAKETDEVAAEARRKGAKTNYKDLGGYPTQTIDTPAVNSLRNSYQSAFSHYLAGFVYEALDEPSLAAAGYRQAVELRPNIALLEEGLAGLDQRSAARAQGDTDVLFVIETGSVPGRRSEQFVLPIVNDYNWLYVPVSFPVLTNRSPGYAPLDIQISGIGALPVAAITDLDAMARRALRDEMPGIMLRSVIRSAVKGIAQSQSRRHDKYGLGFLAITLGSLLTESADERGWRTLPGLISVARGRLPQGEHSVSLNTPSGTRTFNIKATGRHMVVALRLVAGTLYVMAPDVRTGGGPVNTTRRDPLDIAPDRSPS